VERALQCRERFGRRARFHGKEALALEALARELAGAADRLGFLARFLFGGLLVVAAQLHLSEDALALHLFLERRDGLIDVVVTDENLHASFLLLWSCMVRDDPHACV
jgi:hypothetical protein